RRDHRPLPLEQSRYREAGGLTAPGRADHRETCLGFARQEMTTRPADRHAPGDRPWHNQTDEVVTGGEPGTIFDAKRAAAASPKPLPAPPTDERNRDDQNGNEDLARPVGD